MPDRTTTIEYPRTTEEVKFTCIRGPKIDYPDAYETCIIEAYSPYFERILDIEGNRHGWNPCEHFKSVQGELPEHYGIDLYSESVGFYPDAYSTGTGRSPWIGYTKFYPFSSSSPFGDPGRLDALLPVFYEPRPDGGFIPLPADIDGLQKRALRTMLPIIKAELSLPNFIYELKDFKRPIRKIASLFTSSSFKDALKKLGLVSKNLTFSQLSKGTAGAYLQAQFNIIPFISDIGRIRAALSRTERRINDFVTREGIPQRKHFTYKWREFPDWIDSEIYGGRPGSTQDLALSENYASRQVTYRDSVYHAQIQYNYNYTDYQRTHASLLGHLDALGLNLNPAIIWNAIPWTFVVDWVLGVGQYLDDMKVDNMTPQINIHRFLWSVKRQRVIVVTKGVHDFYDDIGDQRSQLPAVVQTAYRRGTNMPGSSSIELGGLNLKEFSLGAALVIARRRRH